MWFMLFIVNILEYDHCKHPVFVLRNDEMSMFSEDVCA